MATITTMPPIEHMPPSPKNVILTRKGDVDTFELGLPALDKIIINYAGIPEEKRGGIARALLSASALSCYVGTLSHELKARSANFDTITAEATIELKQNESLHNRVHEIKIEVSVNMNKTDSNIVAVFNECAERMNQGCLITSSIHEGIHMEYSLTPKYEE